MSVAQKSNHLRWQVEETAHDVSESISDCVQDHPLSSVAVVVGAGIGTGLLISMLLGSRREEEYASYARRVGEKMLAGVGSVVPESWMSQFSK